MDRIKVALKKMLLDVDNPRFPRRMDGQAEAIAVLSESRKTLNLAKDVAAWGLSAAEFPIVMVDDDDPGFYVSLEGNRRLAAIKLLDNYELAASDAAKKRFKELASGATVAVPERLEVVVAKSRAEADHWIRLKHGGQLEGVGAVPWSSAELARYNRLQGHPDKNSAALSLLERCQTGAGLSPDEADDFPLTTLQRVLDTSDVKKLLGLKVERGQILTNRPPNELDVLFSGVVRELASGDVKVDHLKTADKIRDYVKAKISANKLKLKTGKKYEPLVASSNAKPQKKPSKSAPRHRIRTTFAPRSFTTKSQHVRLQKVVHELRTLRLNKFSNSGIGLFRMLLEGATILYHNSQKIPRTKGDSLPAGLSAVLKHMTEYKVIEDFQAKPVRALLTARRDSEFSLDAIQSSLHNLQYSLSQDEMKRRWDELQPFLSALCDGVK